MLVCAGDIEEIKGAMPIGVGLINSAVNLTRVCLMNPPEFILFVGTAGSYGGHKIFDIVYSRAAANLEHAFFYNSGYTPLNNLVVADDVATTKGGEVLNRVVDVVSRETIVNSSNYITTSQEVANKAIKAGLALENMEFYSILNVAKEFNIPVGGLFIVTNYCNKDAHKDFKQNHQEAIKRLEEHLKQKVLK